MEIETESTKVNWDDVVRLFQSVGWGQRDPIEVRSAFDRSSRKAFAFDGKNLVGFGRTIDDGRLYATIVDVVVSPTHQKQGVGRAIVLSLQDRLKGFLVVTLTASVEVQAFYSRLGWRLLKTGMLSDNYISPSTTVTSPHSERHC